jgi:hypothetical protein
MKPTQATAHTCTLRKAMNLIIPKITKDLQHNFVHFLVQELGMAWHTTYTKF